MTRRQETRTCQTPNTSTAVGATGNPTREQVHGLAQPCPRRPAAVRHLHRPVAIVVLFPILTDGNLLRPQNISNLVVQNSYILILAIGMMMIIIAGHIDLSVGSVAAFIGAISRCLMVNMELPVVARGHHLARHRRRSSGRGRASGSPTSASRRSS